MKKLPTLRERWIELMKHIVSGHITWKKAVTDFDIYIQFTAQPLELGQFIPCKDGEPMEKPNQDDYPPIITHPESHITKYDRDAWNKIDGDYQKALESVLFEGWKEGQLFFNENGCYGQDKMYLGETIEDLINGGIELTPSDTCKKSICI